MTAPPPEPMVSLLAEILPCPIWVYDAAARLAFVNAAALRHIGLDAAQLPLGTPLADAVRLFAYRGVYGPGDPEEQAAQHLRLDRSRPLRRLLRRADGSCHELHTVPLPGPLAGGGFASLLFDVTSLATGAEEAEALARRLEEVLGRLRSGLAVYDAGNRLSLHNPAYEILYGLPRGQLRPGMTHEEVLRRLARRGEYDNMDPEEAVAERLAVDRSQPFRHQRQRPNGQVLQFESQPMAEGGWLLEVTDITAVKRMEDEARRRAALLDGVLEALPLGIMVLGPDLCVSLLNATGRQMMGGDVEIGEHREAIARRRAERGDYGPGEIEELVRANLTPLGTGPSTRRRSRPNGQVLEIRTAPMPDGGYVQVLADITALHRMQAEAIERARILQLMLDHMRHGIALFDHEKRLITANALAARLIGLPPDLLRPGISMRELREAQADAGEFGDVAAARALIEKVAPRDRSQPFRYTRRRPDGTVLEIASDPTPDGGFVVTYADITAGARAEEENRQQTAMLQAMLNNIRHGIALYGPDRRLRLANPLAGPALGLPSLETEIGVSFDELLERQHREGAFGPEPRASELLAEAAQLDLRKPNRGLRYLPDGRVMEVTSAPLPDGGFVVTHSDVTELEQARASAQQRAATLQAMLDNIRHGIAFYGADGRLVTANHLAADLSGLAPEDLWPGRPQAELLRRQFERGAYGQGPAAEAHLARMLARNWQEPLRSQRRDSSGRVIDVASNPTPDGGYVLCWSDISAVVEAEADAARRAGIMQVMLENIRHGIVLFDAGHRLVTANPVLPQMLGLPEAALRPGLYYRDYIRGLRDAGVYGSGPAAEAEAEDIIRRFDPSIPAQQLRHLPGGRVVEVVSDPTPEGGFVLTYTDVTEDRRVRAELQAAREAAEAANLAKSRFLATMTHELRTPLNAVIGFSEALQTAPDPERTGEYLRSIHEAGHHLLSLINDILDVTRGETSGFQIAVTEVDLAGLCAGVIRVMRAAAATNQVALGLVLAPELPGLRADEVRLRQVLLNLLSNAVKFTPAGGSVTLSVGLEADGALLIRVRDTGIGMRPEDVPRAFEPFTQLDSSLARRFPGSGLGLYLSRALAEAQGATLTLESGDGAGTTAILRFPPERLVTPRQPEPLFAP